MIRSSHRGGLSRRHFLQVAGAAGAGLALAPMIFAAAGDGRLFYTFVNKTNGKWTDDQCFWSLDGGKSWHSFAKEPTAPCPEPFRDCVKGDFWILSPARAGFRKGGKHGDHFDKYVDENWDTYASTNTRSITSATDSATTTPANRRRIFRIRGKHWW